MAFRGQCSVCGAVTQRTGGRGPPQWRKCPRGPQADPACRRPTEEEILERQHDIQKPRNEVAGGQGPRAAEKPSVMKRVLWICSWNVTVDLAQNHLTGVARRQTGWGTRQSSPAHGAGEQRPGAPVTCTTVREVKASHARLASHCHVSKALHYVTPVRADRPGTTCLLVLASSALFVGALMGLTARPLPQQCPRLRCEKEASLHIRTASNINLQRQIKNGPSRSGMTLTFRLMDPSSCVVSPRGCPAGT